VVIPTTPLNPKTGEGTGLAEGALKVNRVVCSGALCVLGALKMNGTGVPAFPAGAPKANGVGLTAFASVPLGLDPEPNINGIGLGPFYSGGETPLWESGSRTIDSHWNMCLGSIVGGSFKRGVALKLVAGFSISALGFSVVPKN
jgi:hypothetical protein